MGWDIEVGEYLGNAKNYFFAPRTNSYTILDGYFYLAQKIRKSVEPIEEDHKLVWLDYKDAIDNMWRPSQSWGVKEAYKKISQ